MSIKITEKIFAELEIVLEEELIYRLSQGESLASQLNASFGLVSLKIVPSLQKKDVQFNPALESKE